MKKTHGYTLFVIINNDNSNSIAKALFIIISHHVHSPCMHYHMIWTTANMWTCLTIHVHIKEDKKVTKQCNYMQGSDMRLYWIVKKIYLCLTSGVNNIYSCDCNSLMLSSFVMVFKALNCVVFMVNIVIKNVPFFFFQRE